MEASELKEILDQHKLWLDANRQGGGRADLTGANLYDADLTGADLRGAILRDANLTRAILYGADLEHANLTHANLTHANLTHANLYGADLTGTILTRANLYGAILTGANLTGANLTDANLSGAILRGASLSGAILPDISWIIPGCLAQLNEIKHGFFLAKESKWENFVQDSIGFFIQYNLEEKTFDILLGDRIIRNIPDWIKYSGMKQVAAARKEESHD